MKCLALLLISIECSTGTNPYFFFVDILLGYSWTFSSGLKICVFISQRASSLSPAFGLVLMLQGSRTWAESVELPGAGQAQCDSVRKRGGCGRVGWGLEGAGNQI